MIHTFCMLVTAYPTLIWSGWFDKIGGNVYLIALISFVSFGLILATLGYWLSKYVLKNVPDGKK